MKRIIVKKLFFLVAAGFSFAVNAAERLDVSNEVQLKKTITQWMKKNEIPGVAVEVVERGVSYSYYFGLSDKEHGLPVTGKSIFEIGSLTELFTNLLLAQQITDGKVSLKDSIADYIPDLAISNDYLTKITLFNLATQTSGFPFTVSNETKTRSQLPEYFSNWMPSSVIGSEWKYSRINSGLLGYSLEAATHENLNQLYLDRILRPLGMQLIGIDVPKDLQKDYAKGYGLEGQRVIVKTQWLFPATDAMKASSQDMHIFLKAALQLPGVPAKFVNTMRVTQTAYVKTDTDWQGMGWAINPINHGAMKLLLDSESNPSLGPLQAIVIKKDGRVFNQKVLLDKMGSTDGFQSYIALLPYRSSGIVLLVNKRIPNNEIVKIGREILFGMNNK